MGVDQPGKGTDDGADNGEMPPARDKPWRPPPDKPGSPGQPSRLESLAAAREAQSAQRGERDDEQDSPEDEKLGVTKSGAESEKEAKNRDTSSSAATADDQGDDSQSPAEAQGESEERHLEQDRPSTQEDAGKADDEQAPPGDEKTGVTPQGESSSESEQETEDADIGGSGFEAESGDDQPSAEARTGDAERQPEQDRPSAKRDEDAGEATEPAKEEVTEGAQAETEKQRDPPVTGEVMEAAPEGDHGWSAELTGTETGEEAAEPELIRPEQVNGGTDESSGTRTRDDHELGAATDEDRGLAEEGLQVADRQQTDGAAQATESGRRILSVTERDEQPGTVDQTGFNKTAPEAARRTPEIPIEVDGNQIRGARILSGVKEVFEPYRSTIAGLERQVAVIRFEASPEASPDWQSRMEASRVSAEQKVKSFKYLEYEPNHIRLPPDASPAQFSDVLARLGEDQSTSGIIVQFPPPPSLRYVVQDLAPAKDVDALVNASPQVACATAEGIWRVVEPFTDNTHNVAVVGSRGFVGRGVVHFLQENGIDPLQLEDGDDLTRVREAEIIISVTAQPGILGSDHIRPYHRLVVDSGFVPRQGRVSGDVRSEVYDVPQHITPVPGGIGPVEMAVLMERMTRIDVDPEIPGWRLARRTR